MSSSDDFTKKKSVHFFESQFQRQVRDHDYELNPFETLALRYLKGSILDLGCGLGNLSLEAACRGHRVLAVDGSPTAIGRINKEAQKKSLALEAIQVDLEHWTIEKSYHTIIAIGLLHFFHGQRAFPLFQAIQEHIRPGGRLILNVLIEGTTYMAMFDQQNYHLFRPEEIEEQLSEWAILSTERPTFPAPANTQKVFLTVVAEKPLEG